MTDFVSDSPYSGPEEGSSKIRYFRLMNDPAENWKPYRYAPIYDDFPIIGTYKSTIQVPRPRSGDYLVQEPDGNVYVSRLSDFESFDDVEFDSMPSIESLLEKGIVVEVSEDIKKIDFALQDKLSHLDADLSYLEIALEELGIDMEEKRFGFPTKAARQAKVQYGEVKSEHDALSREYAQIEAELQEKVVKPLTLAQNNPARRIGLDQMISEADDRRQQHLGIMQNHLNPER